MEPPVTIAATEPTSAPAVPNADHPSGRHAFLTGATSGTAHPFSITPVGHGGKFTPEGGPLPYPGNTFLCHLDPSSSAHAAFRALQRELQALPWARHFTYLPPASFHMTVFGGVAGDPLDSEGWPPTLAAGAGVPAVTEHFFERLAGQTGASSLRVRAVRSDHGTSVAMEGVDEATQIRLRRQRDVLRDATGLDRHDHATYGFHVSLAYLTSWIPAGEVQAFTDALDATVHRYLGALQDVTLGPIEVCEFTTMHHFAPVATFGDDGIRRQPRAVTPPAR